MEPSRIIRQSRGERTHPLLQRRPPLPGRRVSLRFRCSGLVLASIVAAAACTVSQDEEVAIGAQNAAKVDSQMPIVHDTMVDRFVTALGRSMASHTSRADLEWHFSVVNSSEVNAFALPGGYIYVNRGAIEAADRLDELAGVMGHEIGHVVRRHGVKQLQERAKGDLGLILLCTLTRACRTLGGQILVGASANAMAAHYSQQDEAQADSEGVLNTLAAGIDPEGLPSFFQKLLDQQKREPTTVEAFFSTHPTDQARITATREEIAAIPGSSAANLIRDTPEFHAIQTYVRALPPPPSPSSSAPTK